MFGSYADEVEHVRSGLTHNIDTHNPVKVNFHEFVAMVRDVRRARTWRGRIGYLLRPPGWAEPAPIAAQSAAAPELTGDQPVAR